MMIKTSYERGRITKNDWLQFIGEEISRYENNKIALNGNMVAYIAIGFSIFALAVSLSGKNDALNNMANILLYGVIAIFILVNFIILSYRFRKDVIFFNALHELRQRILLSEYPKLKTAKQIELKWKEIKNKHYDLNKLKQINLGFSKKKFLLWFDE